MFDITRNEVTTRILEGRRLLSAISADDPQDRLEAAATCRGLLFVQLYGVYEYAVRTSVQASLDFLTTASLSCVDIRRSLLTLVLHPQWTSAATAGTPRLWSQRLALLDSMANSNALTDLDNTLFPSDGSHYRANQLRTIWSIFGITLPIVPDSALIGRIDELVEKRNAIAHGRETARAIGSRHSTEEMEVRLRDTEIIAYYVIDTMNTYCLAGGLRNNT